MRRDKRTICRWAARAAVICLASLLVLACQPRLPSSGSVPGGFVPLNHLPALSGDYFEWRSDSVGRSFHIYTRFPEGYESNSDDYPVVYLLDGDSLFPILASSHLFLSYDDDLPEALIVGIAYGSFDPVINRRDLDFSAPAPDARPNEGGAPVFQAFLKNELIPEVERRYRADPMKRILFGQSRGGYMVLYSAFTDPDLFWGYIASNPTFDPGRERLFSAPAPASRNDLGLVVTSGSRDRPDLRRTAIQWYDTWKDVNQIPWSLNFTTIKDGTHAADSARSYRAAMLWLFDRGT